MSSMFLYCVRHGQSVDNENQVHQNPHSELSAKGREQTKYVAQKLRQLPVDLIISSPFLRAKNTAEIISGSVSRDIIYTDLLREVLWPKELHGKYYEDPESLGIRQQIHDRAHDAGWRYSDEENFGDYINRASRFLDWLGQYNQEHIVAVTHGRFLKVLLAVMLWGKDCSYALTEDIREFFDTANTGITIFEKYPTGRWRLVTWNDYAHLSEIT